MRIQIINKESRKVSGQIESKDFQKYCSIKLRYSCHPEVIKEIQKVLIKYYDLKYITNKVKDKRSILIIPEVENYPTTKYGISWANRKKISHSKSSTHPKKKLNVDRSNI